MSKLQLLLSFVGVIALCQQETTTFCIVDGWCCIASVFILEYRKLKAND